MIPLGISSADQAEFQAALTGAHSIKVTVQIMDLEHRILADVSDRFLDGQVNYLVGGAVSRSLTLSLLDPDRTMHFDSSSPSFGAMYMDRMIQVIYSVRSPDMADWVDVPVFCGPVNKMDRADDVVSVECQGKEVLAYGQAWRPLTIKKGTPKTEALHTVMRFRAGETRFDIPDMASRLPRDMSLGRESRPWSHALIIARSLNRQLFYDGRGTLRMRQLPKADGYVFRRGGTLKGNPQISYTMENLYNTVWVKGATPASNSRSTGANDYFYSAPPANPLSPVKLGRNGVSRYLVEVIEDSMIRSKAEARRVAVDRLNDHLLQAVSVSFESVAVPHLEPNDLCSVATDEFSMPFRFRAATLPLTAAGSMSVGYLHKAKRYRRR